VPWTPPPRMREATSPSSRRVAAHWLGAGTRRAGTGAGAGDARMRDELKSPLATRRAPHQGHDALRVTVEPSTVDAFVSFTNAAAALSLGKMMVRM